MGSASVQAHAQMPQTHQNWSPFAPGNPIVSLKTGYLLMEFIDRNKGSNLMLKGLPQTIHARQALFQSLARVVLDVGRPMERIGALIMHDCGQVTLSNRPLTKALANLENDGIPGIPRSNCDTTATSYITELLDCHDARLEHQPNAGDSEDDIAGQIAVVVMLRGLLPCFTQQQWRRKFVFQLTDLHPGNIFVDDDYMITAICDLEWSCSLPLEMVHPDFRFSGQNLDRFINERDPQRGDRVKQFEQTCRDFADAIATELHGDSYIDRNTLISCLDKKSHWYFAALRNPRVAYSIFVQLLQPLFAPEQLEGQKCIDFQEIVAPYWCTNSSDFLKRKMEEHRGYINLLHERRQKRL